MMKCDLSRMTQGEFEDCLETRRLQRQGQPANVNAERFEHEDDEDDSD